eukprot:TRINITY_DN5033_c0_g1_i3.p1 TRINITY_DN5033_c0_g1~~TRINITY_DN5033_c0_g1_i3.p1  ORF type:complete len:107 (-),score=41.62 TRINITY_DN5033_c0_g1_i3:38-358(-)
MIRRPPRSTQSRSSAASDVYKRQMYQTSKVCVIREQLKGYLLNLPTAGLICAQIFVFFIRSTTISKQTKIFLMAQLKQSSSSQVCFKLSSNIYTCLLYTSPSPRDS